MAQVYSVNGVGYYTLDLPAGFSMIANQLNNGDNGLNTILPSVPVNTVAAKWNNSTQAFDPQQRYYGPGLDWADAALNPSTTTVDPGEGLFLNMAAPASLTFVGEIPQGSAAGGDALTVTIGPAFNMISQPTPQSIGFAASGVPATVNDVVQFWDNSASPQRFKPALKYYGPGLEWADGALNTVDPTPAVGEAFFYNSAAAGVVAWTRDFSINN
jgi:hypothetical protein